MARGRRGRGTKAKKPARGRKPAKRTKAAARKPAKRRAAKAKPSRARAKAKAPAKRAVAKKPRVKKAAPPKQQKLEVDVIDVETIEEVAPGVAVVTDYEIVGVRPAAGEAKDDEPESQGS
jgi:hypothetical protein